MNFHTSFKKKTLKPKLYEQEPILSKHHHYTDTMTLSNDEIIIGNSQTPTCQSSRSRTLLKTQKTEYGSGSWSSEGEVPEGPSRPMTVSRLLDPWTGPKVGRSRSGTLEGDEEEEDPLSDDDVPDKYKRTQFNSLTVIQWVSLVLILAFLVCTIYLPGLKKIKFKGFGLWKWDILVLVLVCGRLVSGWGIRIIVLLIERNFLLRKRVLYFVYGLRNPVQNCLWLGVGLITWHFLFGVGEKGSKCLEFLSKVLICLFVGTFVWLVKTLFVKVLASLFHVSRFFDRIHESVFNQYVIDALTGPPKFENVIVNSDENYSFFSTEGRKYFEMKSDRDDIGIESSENDSPFGKRLWRKLKRSRGGKFSKLHKIHDIESGGEDLDFNANATGLKLRKTAGKKEENEILLDNLSRMSSKNVSVWSMKRLIKIIRRGFYYTLDEQILDSTREDEATQKIESEYEAKIAARKIFKNVAERESKFMYLKDLKRFIGEDEALKTMSLLGGAPNTEKISKSILKNWVVNAVRERRALALTLDDTKTAVNTLHRMVNVLVSIIIAITCFLILEILTSKFLLFISSQIVVLGFIFGNSCRTVFESIIFLFVIHPYDVGDRCEIDGVQMVVEEMNILSTVFLKFDNQKVVYPNGVLSTKPISNYNRSPDMGDSIDFYVHIATSTETISIMKQRIISFIDSKKEHWHPSPTIVLKDLEELTNIKFSVWLRHRMNHQDILEKWARRGLVLEEMIKIFVQLDIEYRFSPLDVNVLSISQSSNPTGKALD